MVLSDTLKQLQMMLKSVLQLIDNLIPIRYFVLDGYFGNNNALQMVKQGGLHLISKLRADAALFLSPTANVYQMELRHKKFPDPLNVVCIKKNKPNHETTSTHLIVQF